MPSERTPHLIVGRPGYVGARPLWPGSARAPRMIRSAVDAAAPAERAAPLVPTGGATVGRARWRVAELPWRSPAPNSLLEPPQ